MRGKRKKRKWWLNSGIKGENWRKGKLEGK